MAGGLFNDFNPFQRVPANQTGFQDRNTVIRGSLIAFSYPYSLAKKQPYIIHDPYPLLVVTDIWPTIVRGVNLHYMTFPYIKRILTQNKTTPYSYKPNVKPDKYMASAFRMYYRQGMSKVKVMDLDFLLRILGAVRSFSESEVETIKQQIRNQIRQHIQVKADQLSQAEALNKSQMNQLSRKAIDMQQSIQGGVDRGLIKDQSKTGKNPANFDLPAGGQFSTEDMS